MRLATEALPMTEQGLTYNEAVLALCRFIDCLPMEGDLQAQAEFVKRQTEMKQEEERETKTRPQQTRET